MRQTKKGTAASATNRIAGSLQNAMPTPQTHMRLNGMPSTAATR